jgi:hypothetical protein
MATIMVRFRDRVHHNVMVKINFRIKIAEFKIVICDYGENTFRWLLMVCSI